MNRIFTLIALFALSMTPARADQSLADLSFLQGHWRGDDDGFAFEEIWTGPEGGVMTAMARGVRDGELAVLEYILLTEEDDGSIVMRFKHFNTDYSNWEGEDEAPIILHLADLAERNALFKAPQEDAEVNAIRYRINDAGQMLIEVALIQDGEKGGFTLTFDKVVE